jgi:hypothetical protein
MHRFFIILVVAAILGSLLFKCGRYTNKETITTKVVDKERVTKSDGNGGVSSFYLIFTEDGTYKLEDEILYMNFNSSDWYGKIRKDSTYRFDIIGYRIGFLSEYPNIVKMEGPVLDVVE